MYVIHVLDFIIWALIILHILWYTNLNIQNLVAFTVLYRRRLELHCIFIIKLIFKYIKMPSERILTGNYVLNVIYCCYVTWNTSKTIKFDKKKYSHHSHSLKIIRYIWSILLKNIQTDRHVNLNKLSAIN